MIVRLAETRDVKAISALITASTKRHILPDLPEQVHSILLGSMTESEIQRYLSLNYVYYVAENQLAGIIGVVAIRDNSHLYHFFVADEYHGNGVSSVLWQTAKLQSIAAGNLSGFTVNSAVGAEKVYLKMGFMRINGIREQGGMIDIPMLLSNNAISSI